MPSLVGDAGRLGWANRSQRQGVSLTATVTIRRRHKIRRMARRLPTRRAFAGIVIVLEIKGTLAQHTKIGAVVHRQVDTTLKAGNRDNAGAAGRLAISVAVAMNQIVLPARFVAVVDGGVRTVIFRWVQACPSVTLEALDRTWAMTGSTTGSMRGPAAGPVIGPAIGAGVGPRMRVPARPMVRRQVCARQAIRRAHRPDRVQAERGTTSTGHRDTGSLVVTSLKASLLLRRRQTAVHGLKARIWARRLRRSTRLVRRRDQRQVVLNRTSSCLRHSPTPLRMSGVTTSTPEH